MTAARLLLPMLAAFWPAWKWWAGRILSDPEQAWGLVALATAIALCWQAMNTTPPRWLPAVSLLLIVAFAVIWRAAPPLVATTFAAASIGLVLSLCRGAAGSRAAILGLFAISLPLFSTAEYLAGFPMRIAASYLAQGMLGLAGIPIRVEATALRWSGGIVEIGAPCSGIHMLWAGLFFGLAAAARRKLGWRRTAAAAVLSVAAILVGNGARSAALFFLESGLVAVPPAASSSLHTGVGLVVFSLTAILTLRCAR